MLIDCHIHQPSRYQVDPTIVPEQERVARESGVGAWIVTSVSLEDSVEVLRFAGGRDDYFSCVGIHPLYTADFDHSVVDRLERLIGENKNIVGIGEVGLDYVRTDIEPAIQEFALREQISLAKNLRLPLNLHTYGREAGIDLARVLQETQAQEVGGVVHNFMGNLDMVHALAAMGFCVSASVVLMHPDATRLRGVFRLAPLDTIVSDTDWPAALLERTGPGSYPFEMDRVTKLQNLRRIADRVAEERDMDVNTLAAAIEQNTRRVFPLLTLG